MYRLSVYITPDDIIDRLSDEDKKRFNQGVFTDVKKEMDGSVTIECIVFNDDNYVRNRPPRQRYCGDNISTEVC